MTIVKKSLKGLQGRTNIAILDRPLSDDDVDRFAAEDDVDLGAEWFPAPRLVRDRLGKTQKEIAVMLHIPLSTWQNWEQGRKTPDPAARTLLRIIYREPEAVQAAMA